METIYTAIYENGTVTGLYTDVTSIATAKNYMVDTLANLKTALESINVDVSLINQEINKNPT